MVRCDLHIEHFTLFTVLKKKSTLLLKKVSQDSSFDTVIGYGLDDRGLIPSRGKIFSLLHSVQHVPGAFFLYGKVAKA
jgi:hypothetical protein